MNRRSSRPRAKAKRTTIKKGLPPKTAAALFAQPKPFQDTWKLVLDAIAKMRSGGLSLNKAAKEVGVNPRTVTRWAGRAIKKQANGRYTVSRTDSLLRVLKIPSSEGPREISLRNSRYASTVARYSDAVQKYLRTGDASALKKFVGKKLKDSNGTEVSLLTDLKELKLLASAGVLSFESLYSRST